MPQRGAGGNVAYRVARRGSGVGCEPGPKPLVCRDMAHATRSAPATPPSRLDWLLLGAALVLALVLRLLLMRASSGITMDSALYVRMAEDLAAGRHAAAPAHHGYPMLVALAARVLPGRELPGRAVSLVASLALVALVWRVARRRLGPGDAFVPTVVVALHPLLAIYGTAIMTEATFLTLAFAAVALLDAGRARAGGALFGLAWWVRPEAAVLAPLAVLLAPLRARERWLALALAACVALPYTIVLRVEQGYWSLTPKTVLVRAPFASGRAAEWRLSDSGAFADTVGLSTRWSRDGAAILRAYPARLLEQVKRVLEAWSWPWLVLSLAAIAGVAAARGPWLAFAILPFVYPLLAAPADLRFAQLTLPALLLPLAFAARGMERAAPSRWRVWNTWGPRVALLALVLVWLGPAGRLALAFDDGPVTAMRGAGAWLAAHTAPDAVIMDRKSYVAFFANRRHVQLPDEPLDALLDYARSSGATHLVVEEYVVRSLRPQLAPLLDTDALAGEHRVRLVFAARPVPGDGVAVLEVVR